jgi:hypothetical protein
MKKLFIILLSLGLFLGCSSGIINKPINKPSNESTYEIIKYYPPKENIVKIDKKEDTKISINKNTLIKKDNIPVAKKDEKTNIIENSIKQQEVKSPVFSQENLTLRYEPIAYEPIMSSSEPLSYNFSYQNIGDILQLPKENVNYLDNIVMTDNKIDIKEPKTNIHAYIASIIFTTIIVFILFIVYFYTRNHHKK